MLGCCLTTTVLVGYRQSDLPKWRNHHYNMVNGTAKKKKKTCSVMRKSRIKKERKTIA